MLPKQWNRDAVLLPKGRNVQLDSKVGVVTAISVIGDIECSVVSIAYRV